MARFETVPRVFNKSIQKLITPTRTLGKRNAYFSLAILLGNKYKAALYSGIHTSIDRMIGLRDIEFARDCISSST